MKVVDTYWFNGGGIVRVLEDDGVVRYYIRGIEMSNSAENDAQKIAEWGNSFPREAGEALFGSYRNSV